MLGSFSRSSVWRKMEVTDFPNWNILAGVMSSSEKQRMRESRIWQNIIGLSNQVRTIRFVLSQREREDLGTPGKFQGSVSQYIVGSCPAGKWAVLSSPLLKEMALEELNRKMQMELWEALCQLREGISRRENPFLPRVSLEPGIVWSLSTFGVPSQRCMVSQVTIYRDLGLCVQNSLILPNSQRIILFVLIFITMATVRSNREEAEKLLVIEGIHAWGKNWTGCCQGPSSLQFCLSSRKQRK